ncbi:MAG: ABC transporter ATP-binding protein [Candidatus Tectomicrobia bacterium]|nr:ABC transporter ATP-binding protein [Candidatus Tectomicrobia bacterium]
MKGEALLTVENLESGYGRLQVLWDISFQIFEGEVVALLGSNGAGKTTTLRTLSGLIAARGGRVLFCGEGVQALPVHSIAERGLIHVPEGRRVFSNMTVLENLEMGANPRRARTRFRESLAWVYDLFPRLAERGRQLAGTLSGGEQQMLAIGRGLMSRPRLLLLDEPSIGLMPKLVDALFESVQKINAQGVTVLLAEQNGQEALEVADRYIVLETGRITHCGRAGDLQADVSLREAYLGL